MTSNEIGSGFDFRKREMINLILVLLVVVKFTEWRESNIIM